jgi:hypothetical protein
MQWHGLTLSTGSPIELIEVACGRDGDDAKLLALARFQDAYAPTPACRRMLLHAAAILVAPFRTQRVDYCTPMASFIHLNNAARFLHVYAVTSSRLDAGPSYDLAAPVDWNALGLGGTDVIESAWSERPSSPALSFIRDGGQCCLGRTHPPLYLDRSELITSAALQLQQLGGGRHIGAAYAGALHQLAAQPT